MNAKKCQINNISNTWFMNNMNLGLTWLDMKSFIKKNWKKAKLIIIMHNYNFFHKYIYTYNTFNIIKSSATFQLLLKLEVKQLNNRIIYRKILLIIYEFVTLLLIDIFIFLFIKLFAIYISFLFPKLCI